MSRHDPGGGWLPAGGWGIPRRRRTWCGLREWVPTCRLHSIPRRPETSWGPGHSKRLPNQGLEWPWLGLLSQNLEPILLGTWNNDLTWYTRHSISAGLNKADLRITWILSRYLKFQNAVTSELLPQKIVTCDHLCSNISSHILKTIAQRLIFAQKV